MNEIMTYEEFKNQEELADFRNQFSDDAKAFEAYCETQGYHIQSIH